MLIPDPPSLLHRVVRNNVEMLFIEFKNVSRRHHKPAAIGIQCRLSRRRLKLLKAHLSFLVLGIHNFEMGWGGNIIKCVNGKSPTFPQYYPLEISLHETLRGRNSSSSSEGDETCVMKLGRRYSSAVFERLVCLVASRSGAMPSPRQRSFLL